MVRQTTSIGFQSRAGRAESARGRILRLEVLERRCLLSVTPGGSECCSRGDVIYHEDFEGDDGAYTADNTGGTYTGLWHYSIGRRDDGLDNHTPTHSWYYGVFETATGGGEYYIGRNHQGTLTSPTLPTIPECGTTMLGFNYLLDTRDQVDRDFVEVRIVKMAGDVEESETTIFSRAGTEGEELPETGNAWYTACYDVTAYAGKDIRVRFFFDTGDPPELDPEGWYVDDVRLVNCPPSVQGIKYNDLNEDGARDANESGLSGWEIRAYRDSNDDGMLNQDEYNNGAAFTTETHDEGQYCMNLEPGEYVIVEVLQEGWHQSAPSTPVLAPLLDTGDELLGFFGYEVTIDADTRWAEQDFGNFEPDAGGVKFYDENGINGQEAGEPELSGWTILAFIDDGDGLLQQDEYHAGPAFTDVTDCRGEYGMVLDPGDYVIVEVLQDGWHQSWPTNPVLDPSLDTGAVRLGCFGYAVTIDGETPEVDRDFGNFEPDAGGVKFYDENGINGQEAGEPELSGWAILAFADDGDGLLEQDEYDAGPAFTDVTDCRGEYGMVLDPGDYVIVEVLQDGWHQSWPTNPVLDPSLDTGVVRLGCFGYAVTIDGETPEVDRDFGNFEPDASGVKFNDLNGNGERDESELGIPGWTILAFADTNGDGLLQPDERTDPAAFTAITDCRGEYGMALPAGDYVIVEELQAGWQQSYPSEPVLDPPLDPEEGRLGCFGYGVTVTGEPQTGLDFGNFEPDISGVKFNDLNGNGVRDDGEPGIPGWTILAFVDTNGDGLLQPDERTDPAAFTAITDCRGEYGMVLPEGNYVIVEELQAGWQQSYPSEPVLDPPLDPEEGRLGCFGYGVTVTGEPQTGLDFGNFEPDISGVKFNDLNGNGVRDDGEPGIPGWTILAFVDTNGDGLLQPDERTDPTAFTAVTDCRGEYGMVLPDGDYVIVEVLEAGWHQSYPSQPVLDPPLDPEEGRLGCFGYGVTVTGEPQTDLDFGNFEPDLSGVKFNDLNGNGVRDDGEPGIPGWTILAFVDTNGDGLLQPDERTDPTAYTAVTDCRGEYGMVLPDGDYVIVEVLEAGWHQSYPSEPVLDPEEGRLGCFGYGVTVAGEPQTDLDFGNFEPDVSGVKFNDLNGNGSRDEGEPGIPGWTILVFADTNGDGQLQLDERTDPVAFTAVTDCRGEYGMVLPEGNYVIVEELQAGWHQSYPSEPVLDPPLDPEEGRLGCFGYGVTVTGEPQTGLDFGNFEPDLSGVKFNDLNGNGVRDDGEPGLPGWTILAFADTNGDGQLQLDERTDPAAFTAITDCRGEYGMVLPDGDYVIVEVLEAGWHQSYPSQPVLDPPLDPEEGRLGCFGYGVTVTGEPQTGLDFGNFEPDISGVKFNDLNGNGVRDDGEPGIPGWTILAFVDTNGDGLLQPDERTDPTAFTAVTDCRGEYGMVLPDGDYVIVEVLEAGWHQSYPSEPVLDPPLDPEEGRLGCFGYGVTVTGEPQTGLDFGNFEPDISGVKFNDLNGNGVRDDGEPGIPGWTILAFVDTNGDGVLQPDERTDPTAFTAVTDCRGEYGMVLPDGDYVIVEVLEAGWHQSYPSEPVLDPPLDPEEGRLGCFGYGVTVAGEPQTDLDFGNFEPDLSGVKFNDLNGNGVRDDGEPGLPGWTILVFADTNGDGQLQLDERTDPAAFTAITDCRGEYGMVLPAGDYVIVEELQAGWHQSYPSEPVLDPPLDPEEGRLGCFGYGVTVAGEPQTGLDFGNFEPDLSGVKFNDRNGNGERDEGEPGIPGWTILAFVDTNGDGLLQPDERTDPAAFTAVTDCRGEYGMVLPVGDYVIVEELQAGWHQSYPSEPVLDPPLDPEEGRLGCFGYGVTVAGEPQTDLDFGNFEPDLSGVKFNDLNGNGVRDDGEPGLPGWTILVFADTNGDGQLQLDERTDPAAFTAITDCRGEYGMVLPAGDYVIVEELQAGWHQSYPSEPVLDPPLDPEEGRLGCFGYGVTVAGEPQTGLDFGNFEPDLSGVKFNDRNGNGERDEGEPGIPGWTILAFVDTNGDGLLQPDERTDPAAFTAVTDCRGEYGMVLPDGDYVIVEVLQEGWHQTYPITSVLDVPLDSGDEVLGQFGYAIAVEEETSQTALDFGNQLQPQPQVVQFITPMSVYRTNGPFVRPPDFQIAMAGYVWHDQNANGEWDAGEPGLNGVTVYVDSNRNGQLDPEEFELSFTTVNDGAHDGAFWFAEVRADEFLVRADVPSGLAPPSPDTGYLVTIESGTSLMGGFEQTEVPNFGIVEDFVNNPPDNVATIHGYKWHDINQDGIWDADEPARVGWRIYQDLNGDNSFNPQTEPRTLTSTDGSYVFSNLTPGTYTLREVERDLSDGTFSVQRFPGPDPNPTDPLDPRDPDEYQLTVAGGQLIEGRFGFADEPNFGSFEYSPFTRPADDLIGHLDADSDGVISLDEQASNAELMTALSATGWHTFTVTNNTGSDFNIDRIDRNIDVSQIEVADRFVSIFWRQEDGTLVRIVPPLEPSEPAILVPDGETVEFMAFYDPALRDRDSDAVEAQYPDWFGDGQNAMPAHMFVPGDHLSVVTDNSLSFRIDLTGASTYDSDIFCDGAVDRLDLQRLDEELLQRQWPIVAGDPLFDLTSDINARHPNGAEDVLGTTSWPIDGPPRRELGLGDFGPLNVEFDRARAPFLDLDADNSSGQFGTDYRTDYAGTAVPIVDYDMSFANRLTRQLSGLSVSVTTPTDFHHLTVNPEFLRTLDGITIVTLQQSDGTKIDTNITVEGNKTSTLRFVTDSKLLNALPGTVDVYREVLREITYSNDDPAIGIGTVTIQIQGTGDAAAGAGRAFTALLDDRELEGNVAVSTILIRPSVNPIEETAEALVPQRGQPLSILASSTASTDSVKLISEVPESSSVAESGGMISSQTNLAAPSDGLGAPRTGLLSTPKLDFPIQDSSESNQEKVTALQAEAIDECLVNDCTFVDSNDPSYLVDFLAQLVSSSDKSGRERESLLLYSLEDVAQLILMESDE